MLIDHDKLARGFEISCLFISFCRILRYQVIISFVSMSVFDILFALMVIHIYPTLTHHVTVWIHVHKLLIVIM
jgi:hypothetical protein